MRHFPVPFALLCTIALGLIGCGDVRTVSYTFHKSGVTQLDLIKDEEKIKDTSGVENVISSIDSLGNASVIVYLDEENKTPALKRMVDKLGYQMVTP